MTKICLKLLVLLAAFAVSSCSNSGASEQNIPISGGDTTVSIEAKQSLLGAQHVTGGGIEAVSLSTEKGWLVTEQNRIALWSHGGELLAQYAGTFDTLSATLLDNSNYLVAALDRESGLIELITLDRSRFLFNSVWSIENDKSAIENQCFHQRDDYLSLVTIDVKGDIEEWLLDKPKTDAFMVRALRQFSMAQNTVACTSDGENLYFLEGHVGVWSVDGNPESDSERHAVLLFQPLGLDEASDVHLIRQGSHSLTSLAIAFEDEHKVLVSSLDGEVTHVLELIDKEKPKQVSTFYAGNTLFAGAYDDRSDGYALYEFEVIMPLPSPEDGKSIPKVFPMVETQAVEKFGDAADDPAIWVNQIDSTKSRILGTDKRSGLSVYDLQGTKLQHLSVGRLNNVDMRSNVGRAKLSIAAASNRTQNSISLFLLDQTSGKVEHLTEVATTLKHVYGLCMATWNDETFVFINDTNGDYQQYSISVDPQGNVSSELVRSFSLPSQPEGCVADDQRGDLYMGEEAAGIWRTHIAAKSSDLNLLVTVDNHLHADVEGLSLYVKSLHERYVIASSQGSDSYAVYKVDNGLSFVGDFSIGMNLAKGLDGVSETDGLDVTSASLPGFSKGILVVQDGRNQLPTEPQNFKIIDWKDVEALIFPHD